MKFVTENGKARNQASICNDEINDEKCLTPKFIEPATEYRSKVARDGLRSP